MKIGYISEHRLEPNRKQFTLREAPYTRKISDRGDKVFSKILAFPFDYSEVENNTKMLNGLILINEPFFLDKELKARVKRWIEWANSVDPSEYDPFVK